MACACGCYSETPDLDNKIVQLWGMILNKRNILNYAREYESRKDCEAQIRKLKKIFPPGFRAYRYWRTNLCIEWRIIDFKLRFLPQDKIIIKFLGRKECDLETNWCYDYKFLCDYRNRDIKKPRLLVRDYYDLVKKYYTKIDNPDVIIPDLWNVIIEFLFFFGFRDRLAQFFISLFAPVFHFPFCPFFISHK